jgi:CheY-like chemotaxis protein
MGGRLGVESDVDRGSTFWVELRTAVPSHETAAPPPDVASSSEPENAVTGTILYIEDNSSNVRLVERLLRQRRPGVTLLTAGDGNAGFEMALEHRPDLIFLDLHLPDLHGEEVLKRLGEDARTREIPVAILSADATSSQNRRLMAAGAKAYLTKPLDVSQMLSLVDERLTPRSRTQRIIGPRDTV